MRLAHTGIILSEMGAGTVCPIALVLARVVDIVALAAMRNHREDWCRLMATANMALQVGSTLDGAFYGLAVVVAMRQL